MKTIPVNVIFILIFLCVFVGKSYGGSEDILKLVKNKSFWTSHQWGKLEDSKIYTLSKWDKSSDSETILETKSRILDIDSLFKIIISEDSESVVQYSFDLNGSKGHKEYEKLIKWCEGNFGKSVSVFEDKTETRDSITYTEQTYWKVGNTIVSVVHSKFLIEGINLELVRLTFSDKENYKILKPLVTLKCSNIKLTSDGESSKMDDKFFLIDEYSKMVKDVKYKKIDSDLIVTDNIYYLDKTIGDDNLTFKIRINRLNWKLEGQFLQDGNTTSISGNCKKVKLPKIIF